MKIRKKIQHAKSITIKPAENKFNEVIKIDDISVNGKIKIYYNSSNRKLYYSFLYKMEKLFGYSKYNNKNQYIISSSNLGRRIIDLSENSKLIIKSEDEISESSEELYLEKNKIYTLKNGYNVKLIHFEPASDFAQVPQWIGMYTANGLIHFVRFDKNGRTISHTSPFDIKKEFAGSIYLVVYKTLNTNKLYIGHFRTMKEAEEFKDRAEITSTDFHFIRFEEIKE